MLYNLVLSKNNPYARTAMAHIPAEVSKAWDKVFSEETFAKYGMKWVVYCDSTWANEEYGIFAIHTQRDIASRIAYWKEIEKASWYPYVDLFSLLGTSDEEQHMPTFPNPIYQLFIVRNDPATAANLARETKEEAAARDEKWNESIKRSGACGVLLCDTYWANEDYLGFGVFAFPSVEARQAHARDLLEMKWNQFYSAFTLLGIPRA